MLERSYESYTLHEERPVTAEDASYVRVENYRELVSAVLYLVSARQEEGVIRLYNYAGDVEADLAQACLEVAAQDPLGAYAVEYIKHEYTRVVSYYQAAVSIRYRRTAEQMRSIVSVTGAPAIRARVREALVTFAPEVVVRVAYFAEDEASIAALVRQAYYDAPECALGMPETEISIYPDTGRERVLEICLRYPETRRELERRQKALAERARELSAGLWDPNGAASAGMAAQRVREQAVYDPAAPSTAYAALVEGKADDTGLALACELLCRQAGVSCEIIQGLRAGEPRRWLAVRSGDEPLYMDPAAGDPGEVYTAQELAALDYDWPGAPEEEQPEESKPPAMESGGSFAGEKDIFSLYKVRNV